MIIKINHLAFPRIRPLTTGVDIINGTAGNDLIIADNTAGGKQLSSADQISGGAGTDTLKIFVAAGDTVTGQPATLTSIENVWINGGILASGGLVGTYTAAAGTTGLTIEAPVLANATVNTYTINGQAVTLMTQNVATGNTQGTTIVQAAASTATSVAVTLNGWTSTGTGVNTLDLSGATVTTANITATGAASKVTLNNTGAAITTLNIAGDKGVTLTQSAPVSAAVTTINAASNTGGVTIVEGAAAAAGFKFTGGSGNDTISFANDQFTTLTAGTQLAGGAGTADKIGLFDTVLSAAEAAKVNAVIGFEVLGLNAAITLDASTVSTFKAFSIDTAGLTQTVSTLSTASSTTITAAPGSLTLATAVGVTDHTINIGSATSAGIAAGTVVVTGITSLNVTSNGTAANSITLTNSDNSIVTLKGAQDVTLTLAAGATVGSKIDASAFTGKATLTGSTIAGSGDIIIGGAGADRIQGLSGNDTLTGNGGADTFVYALGNPDAGFDNAVGLDTITDFLSGTDKIALISTNTIFNAVNVNTAVTVATAADAAAIATALGAATVASSTTAQVTLVTVTAGAAAGTYVYVNDTVTGASATGDLFIKMTGLTTITAADFVFA
jgi:hypothetical protein